METRPKMPRALPEANRLSHDHATIAASDTVIWTKSPTRWLEQLHKEIVRRREGINFGLSIGPSILDAINKERRSFIDTRRRRRVDSTLFAPGARTAVALCFGQSNIANEGEPAGIHVPGPGVYNFNFLDGRCYIARDPLLGSTGIGGNLATRLGDLLVTRGLYDRVLLVSIGHGGTSTADWAPGGRMGLRLMLTLELLEARKITLTHLIWQQGEAEGALGEDGGTLWTRSFASMLSSIRNRGVTAPIYVPQCTVCRGARNEGVRAAQRAVVDPDKGVRSGPDTDVIGVDQRWDGCHFSTDGLRKAAELWFEILAAEARRSEKSRL